MVNEIAPGLGMKSAHELAGYRSESERLNERQQRTMSDLLSRNPNIVNKAVPLTYDNDGMLIFPEIQQPQEQTQQVTHMQQSQQFDPSAFFGSAPQAQAQQPQPVQQQAQQVRQTYQQPVQQQAQPVQQQQQVQQVQQMHPVVQNMLKNFGIKRDKRHSLKVYNDNGDFTEYSMTIIPEELQSWALAESKVKLRIDGEEAATVYFQVLYVCCSVVAIDNQPIWAIFNIQPQGHENDRLANDPYDISLRIRKVVARELASIMWSGMRPISDKLLEFYQSQIIGKVESSFDMENQNKVRFVCPLDGCTNYEFLEPKEGVPYFCKYDGTLLVQTMLNGDAELPLV